MKMILVTDTHGALVGTIRGHDLSAKKDGWEAGIVVSPDHKHHAVDVDDSLANITDAVELHTKVAKFLPKH